MDEIRESFKRVKQDINSLRKEIITLNQKIEELSMEMLKAIPTHSPQNPTPALGIPTDNFPLKPLKAKNMQISTGNEGVPTNKQTNKPTNQQMEKQLRYGENSLEEALEILNSLDSIKKDIRLRFKRLTEQEFLIFSTIYQIEEEQGVCDYRAVSVRLGLSETSIRDYVRKLIKKGISVEKIKINNKNVQLKVSEKLKKVAPLPIILQLRDI